MKMRNRLKTWWLTVTGVSGPRHVASVLWDAVLRRLVHTSYRWGAVPLARVYRPMLLRVAFVGVTGSCGKSTTKELIAAILGPSAVQRTPGNLNQFGYFASTILRTRPWHRCCVVEMSAYDPLRPGSFADVIALVKPKIAVVTNVGGDHLAAFGS